MAANKFINTELDWAESQLSTWRAYIDANPFHEMEDRIKLKETKNGGTIPVPVATIEQQQKNIRDTIKDYLSLLEIVKKLRAENAEQEGEAFAGAEATPMMLAHGRDEE